MSAKKASENNSLIFSASAVAASGLQGHAYIPGDKSISHRSLILNALANGEAKISGLLEGEDVLATAAALKAMGAAITRIAGGEYKITGLGIGGLQTPDTPLDLGNSGTGCRLLMGAVAGCPITAEFTGDASLSSRPMGRILLPLAEMGAEYEAQKGVRLPVRLTGCARPGAYSYRLPVASAQVKSAILLAGLAADGIIEVIEPKPTRDHTERMLTAMGANITSETDNEGGNRIRLEGGHRLHAADVVVPSDPSSAAFPLVAALITPGSQITLPGIGLNPGRTGLIESLTEMGADMEIANKRDIAGEPVGDITARYSKLRGITVPEARAASMIDEYPVLAMAAAHAEGVTHMPGIGELRVKESDRIALTANGLAACGVAAKEGEDSLTVTGAPGKVRGGALIETGYDHRIAMSFLVLGLTSENPVSVRDADSIATSFPGFAKLMRRLGADISENETGA